MKKLLTLTLLLALALGATAQVRTFGIGLIIGEPTGLSAKWNLDKTNALVFHLAWSLRGGIAGGADYLIHTGWLPAPWRPYLGFGARIAIWDHDNAAKPDELDEGETELHVSGRGLIGIEYLFLEGHLGVALEVGLGLDFIPAVDFDVSGGLALRYYF